MNVDIDGLRAGADRSYRAADFAKDAADQLTGRTVNSGIFGSFEAAQAFHVATSTARSNHADALRGHERGLGVLGDKAHRTASAFSEMEDRNAAALRAVPWPATPA